MTSKNSATSLNALLASTKTKKTEKALAQRDLTGTKTIFPWPCGYFYARVYDVYDGDTCSLVYYLDKTCKIPLTIKLRVKGVDTPERRTKNSLEKHAANILRKHVRNMIHGHTLVLHLEKYGKYGGRAIGDLYLLHRSNYLTLTDYLLQNKFAHAYDGKTKKRDWTSDELNHIVKSLTKLEPLRDL